MHAADGRRHEFNRWAKETGATGQVVAASMPGRAYRVWCTHLQSGMPEHAQNRRGVGVNGQRRASRLRARGPQPQRQRGPPRAWAAQRPGPPRQRGPGAAAVRWSRGGSGTSGSWRVLSACASKRGVEGGNRRRDCHASVAHECAVQTATKDRTQLGALMASVAQPQAVVMQHHHQSSGP